MHACRNTLLSQCVRVRACRNPRRGHEEMGWRLFVPTNMSPLLQEQTNVHRKQGPDTHTQRALCSITLLAGLTSARMHKHANETRAGAGHSHACSQLHAPTHAAAPEHAFPALWHAFSTPQRRQRQHTRLEDTNTQDKEDKARAQCEARVAVCNASSMPANPRLTPQCLPTARAPAVSMRSHVQADPNTILACKAQFPPRQSPTPTTSTRGSMQPSPAASAVGVSVHVAQALLPFSPLSPLSVLPQPEKRKITYFFLI